MKSNASRVLLRIAAIAVALASLRPIGAMADVEVVLTADNAYGFGWGSGTKIGSTAYYGPILNVNDANGTYTHKTFSGCPTKAVSQAHPNNLDGVEMFTVPSSSIPPGLGYFYVISDSDNSSYQGVLGSFRDLLGSGAIIFTGDPRWEVCATGDDRLDTMNNQFPSLADINARIVDCNKNLGPSAPTTSGGWVDADSGYGLNSTASLGRLFPSPAQEPGVRNGDSSGGHGANNPYGSISCINKHAAWMWFNADPSSVENPLTTVPDGVSHHKEFLIFRLPVDGGATKVCPRLRSAVPERVIAAALADPTRVMGYGLPLDLGKPLGPKNPERTWLSLHSYAKAYHPLGNGLEFKAGCP